PAPVTDDVTKAYEAHWKLTTRNTEPGKETADITLKGIAVKAECALPDTIDFGGVPVGQSATKSVHFQNLTSELATVTLGAISSSNGDNFAFNYGPGWAEGNVAMVSGAMKDVTLKFTPTQDQTYTALVQLKAAEHCAPMTVKLVGTGVEAAITCDALDFAFLPTGLNTSQQTTLTNYGLDPVTVMALSSSTADYAAAVDSVSIPPAKRELDALGSLVLNPGTVKLGVTFKPTKLGPLPAAITGTTSLAAQPRVSCDLK